MQLNWYRVEWYFKYIIFNSLRADKKINSYNLCAFFFFLLLLLLRININIFLLFAHSISCNMNYQMECFAKKVMMVRADSYFYINTSLCFLYTFACAPWYINSIIIIMTFWHTLKTFFSLNLFAIFLLLWKIEMKI